MFKKLYIPFLLTLKIHCGQTDFQIPSDKIFVAGCSTATCQTCEFLHKKCVYNFNHDNYIDKSFAKISGIVCTKHCLDCVIYGQIPDPLVCASCLLAHNCLKITEEQCTRSSEEPNSISKQSIQSHKKIDEIQ